jgi:hypothetical protein
MSSIRRAINQLILNNSTIGTAAEATQRRGHRAGFNNCSGKGCGNEAAAVFAWSGAKGGVRNRRMFSAIWAAVSAPTTIPASQG